MSSRPLLRLPVELHLDISSLLDIRDNVNLAAATRYFRSIIPTPAHGELLVAEESQWARSKQLYVCKGCSAFRPWTDFTDVMRKGKRCCGGAEAAARYWLKCGVKDALYAPGTHLTIGNRIHVLCSICGIITDQIGDQGSCLGCSPNSRRRYARSNHHDHSANDDGWADTTKRISDRIRLREFSMWPED